MKNTVDPLTKSPNAKQRTNLVQIASMALALGVIVAGPAHGASMMDDAIAAYRHGEFEKSAETFSTLATQGNATAQYLLSCQMINGAGMDAQEDAGWDMMKQAAGNQNPDASIVMARKLEAENAPRDLVRSLYQQAADKNRTQALLWLALDAVDQGKSDAAKSMLEQAWDLGDPRAATLLANRFTKSDSGRYQYLRAAAQRGEMRAAAYLAEEARKVDDTAEAVGWCAIATGLPGHNEDVDWKSIGDAVEQNCGQFDEDLEPTARAKTREKVDQFLARFFDGYKPWTPWRACSVR